MASATCVSGISTAIEKVPRSGTKVGRFRNYVAKSGSGTGAGAMDFKGHSAHYPAATAAESVSAHNCKARLDISGRTATDKYRPRARLPATGRGRHGACRPVSLTCTASYGPHATSGAPGSLFADQFPLSVDRILLLAQVFPPRPGGSGRWMWELYRRLTREVVVAAGACPGDRAFDAGTALQIERLNLDFGNWGLLSSSSIEYIAAWRQALSMVRGRGITQLHCAKALPEGLLAYALKSSAGLPYWCFAHGEELRLAATSRELRLLTRKVLHAADRVVANSTFTQSMLLDEWKLPAARVAVMSPGVDTTRFIPGAANPAVRAQLGWTGKRVLLTVGTMQKRKGQDTVIRALPRIRAEHPGVLYVIAGPGLERDYLAQLAADLGVAEAVQFRDAPDETELVDCYQQCDLFVMPNRQIGWDVEGFGIVLLEAQACGKPVIAGRSGGTSDAVEDGVTGYLVNGESTDDVAAAVIRLLDDPDAAARMGRNGRERAVARFDWTQLADRFSHALLEPGAGADARGFQEVSAG